MLRRDSIFVCLLCVLASAVAFACTPAACNEEDSVVGREVESLIGEPGPAVKEAERRLVARGQSAIAILETGLYQADAMGRIRIVKVLAQLGAEARPILEHMARKDDDAFVREQALNSLNKAQGARPERN